MKTSSVCCAVFLSTAFLLCVSCASSPKQETSAKKSNTAAAAPAEQPAQPAKINKLKLYQEKAGDVVLAIVSSPKAVTKGKSFLTPYTVKASHPDGTPAANFEITASYPASRTNDEITFAEQNLTTAADGTASFVPEAPAQSANSIVRFYPSFAEADEQVSAAQLKAAVTAPWRVRTDLMRAGGSIALVDFSQSGTPITSNSASSSALLMNLMKYGFSRIGNADFTRQVVTGDKDAVYKAAKNLLGNSAAYLIYGTVKYETPVTKTENGFTCGLAGEIVCLNMKDGSILYQTKKSVSASDPKEWNVLNTARKQLAEEFTDAVVYGM